MESLSVIGTVVARAVSSLILSRQFSFAADKMLFGPLKDGTGKTCESSNICICRRRHERSAELPILHDGAQPGADVGRLAMRELPAELQPLQAMRVPGGVPVETVRRVRLRGRRFVTSTRDVYRLRFGPRKYLIRQRPRIRLFCTSTLR